MTTDDLKQAFYDEYNGFSDKRIKNIGRGDTFIVDDRGPGDVGADRSLYSYFCMIFLQVSDEKRVQITLRGNVPISADIESWAAEHDADIEDSPQHTMKFVIEAGEQTCLTELANSLRAIVSPGSRYPVANYKYVCPRTAKSLLRVRDLLNSCWDT